MSRMVRALLQTSLLLLLQAVLSQPGLLANAPWHPLLLLLLLIQATCPMSPAPLTLTLRSSLSSFLMASFRSWQLPTQRLGCSIHVVCGWVGVWVGGGGGGGRWQVAGRTGGGVAVQSAGQPGSMLCL